MGSLESASGEATTLRAFGPRQFFNYRGYYCKIGFSSFLHI